MLASPSPIAVGAGCPVENESGRGGGATPLRDPVCFRLGAVPATARIFPALGVAERVCSTSIGAPQRFSGTLRRRYSYRWTFLSGATFNTRRVMCYQ